MFSNLEQLEIGSSIFISDVSKNKIEYIVYDKYSTREDDLSCTASSNQVVLTLITCNKNDNSKRIVIKAKMKES